MALKHSAFLYDVFCKAYLQVYNVNILAKEKCAGITSFSI